MRKYLYLLYDLFCVCATLIGALYLRHGLPLIHEGAPEDLYLLLLVTFLTSIIILPLMRTHRNLWRFTSSSELADIMIAVALVMLVTNTVLFITSRLEMMPRSVPLIHWALAVVLMGGSRLLARQLFRPAATTRDQATSKHHVIVVGVCHTAELYLQFVKRILRHRVIVEGFVDTDETLTHRSFQKHKILGVPGNLPRIIEQFLVHGVHIKQIVLAQKINSLSTADRKMLREMKASGAIDLLHFGKQMGPEMHPRTTDKTKDFYHEISAALPQDYSNPTGYYPFLKRLMDVVGGIILLLLLMPLMALTSLAVTFDVGLPIIFWQQRPGLHGKPFRLYKFRTMRQAGRKHDEDRLSHKSGDELRTSPFGKMLRRLRLDELPQLFHIIAGSMSFVGPRPLLPDDQPNAGSRRLSVRPGATGWAQIHGGDALSPQEKLTLDIWYIEHMSFWLDIRIMLRSVRVVFMKDARRMPAAPTLPQSSVEP